MGVAREAAPISFFYGKKEAWFIVSLCTKNGSKLFFMGDKVSLIGKITLGR